MTSPQTRLSGSGRRAFTLIEIVAVIAVLATLMVAGVSLLGGTSAQARRAGTDMLIGMIEQARSAAITSRCHVILAVAEPDDLPVGDNRLRLGLFKVEAEQWPDDTTETISAALMNRWRMLENGVVLIRGQVDGMGNPMDGGELTVAYGSGTKARTVKVHAIVINPRGGLQHPAGSTPVAMRIAEGYYRSGTATPNRRGDSPTISENRLKIGRVTARPYRTDG